MLPAFPRLSAPARLSGDRRGTLIGDIPRPLPRATTRDDRWATNSRQQERGYPNRDAFRLSRLATNVLALVCACAGVYYAPTGCLCRVRIIERLAAVAMTLAGGLALSAASFWIYRFDMRPYDDDLTDDQMVCDVGCQCEAASLELLWRAARHCRDARLWRIASLDVSIRAGSNSPRALSR